MLSCPHRSRRIQRVNRNKLSRARAQADTSTAQQITVVRRCISWLPSTNPSSPPPLPSPCCYHHFHLRAATTTFISVLPPLSPPCCHHFHLRAATTTSISVLPPLSSPCYHHFHLRATTTFISVLPPLPSPCYHHFHLRATTTFISVLPPLSSPCYHHFNLRAAGACLARALCTEQLYKPLIHICITQDWRVPCMRSRNSFARRLAKT